MSILKIKLIDVGRNNVNKTCQIDCSKGLFNDSLEDTLAEVAGHYLLSSCVEVEATEKKNFFSVFAGFNKVGEIELLGDYLVSENGQLTEINSNL